MIGNFSGWTRMKSHNIPIYVRQETPDWIVPNTAGDHLLQALMEKGESAFWRNSDAETPFFDRLKAAQFLSLLESPSTENYKGRASFLSMKALEECWLHITDCCNLACRHCLFSCSPQSESTLSCHAVLQTVTAAYALGARVYYLTGGEPLVHPDFQDICRCILKDHVDTYLVILTNGVLIPEVLGFLKTLPLERLFLQISVDGIGEVHDRIRGGGTYKKLLTGFSALAGLNIKTTLSMTVHADNYLQMADMAALAGEYDIAGVHYSWLFLSGRAEQEAFVSPDVLFENMVQSLKMAEKHNVVIDNVSNLSAQVFSSPGTKYDLGSAGWSSLALGPEGIVYPTAALVGQAALSCGSIHEESLESIWRFSPVLKDIRSLSIVQDKNYSTNPLTYIVGGGDIDHSYYSGRSFTGKDPYVPLYNRLALWLIAESAGLKTDPPWPQIALKMGEKRFHSFKNVEDVALTHSNCVLTFSRTRSVFVDFYASANEADNEHIIHSVCYPEAELQHIPAAARARSYRFGSPVLDAGICPGNIVVDLGSGTGVACYVAARQVGPKGQVTGIDMLDYMLNKANRYLDSVADNLGYRNVTFKKGHLENVPIEDESADVIISNCVINLSEDKRQTFSEIFRILKPGGRICISDVVTDRPCLPSIRNDAELRGECIAGALSQSHLMTILESAGFQNIRIMKRFFFREVKSHRFYSITYTACRPLRPAKQLVLYPGPHAAVVMDTGDVLTRGKITEVSRSCAAAGDEAIYTLDSTGNISNMAGEYRYASVSPPPKDQGCDSCGTFESLAVTPKVMADCMLCGSPLQYLEHHRPEACVFCGKILTANAVCEKGHFVCDECHSSDMIDMVKYICTHCDESDMIGLMNQLRRHPSFPLHGPEHHFVLPGVILACYKNSGGAVAEADIISAIDRGKTVPGGVCGYWGTCGAAIGTGIAFSIIFRSTPLTPKARQKVQKITEKVIKALSEYESARCCQRETWTALTVAAALSEKYLPIKLKAAGDIQCRQQGKNKECIHQACPYFKRG